MKFDAPIRLLERSCDPLIEESNIIRENWIDYCSIYSIRSDERPVINMLQCLFILFVNRTKLLNVLIFTIILKSKFIL